MIVFLLNNWRLVLVGIALAGLSITATYYKHSASKWEARYESEKTAFADFRAETAAVGMAAEKAARAKEKRQNEKTKESRVAYAKTSGAVSSYWRLRDKPAVSPRGDILPRAPVSTEGTDAASEKQVDGGRSPRREDCAVDAATIEAFQAWVRAQNLPVE